MEKGILCCVFNHNDNDNAIKWWRRLASDFETVILDSGSNPPCKCEVAENLTNIYYSGLINRAYSLATEKGCRWLLVVTSDIEIDEKNTSELIRSLKEISKSANVALYQPSCRWSFKGRALPQSMCHCTGKLRKVNFQEGWFHFLRVDLLSNIAPVDCEINKFGWGIDLALSHFARINKMLVLVDDRVRVLHPRGTGYNKKAALEQMRVWHETIPGYISPRHFKPLDEPIIFDGGYDGAVEV